MDSNEIELETKLDRKDYLNNKKDLNERIFKWLIVLGSFIVYFIADGVSLSFGIFTREFIDHFNKADSQSFVFLTSSLIQAIPLLLSPFVCYLIEITSSRCVTLFGSILISTSFILTRFLVNDLISLNIIIGGMTSCGLAMCYIPAYLIISFHFDKRRAFATGLAVSGSGLGLFVVSPLIEYLIKIYGWMDTCFLFGAISSHTFISACLFIEKKKSPKSTEKKKDANLKQSSKCLYFKNVIVELINIYKNKRFILINLTYFILLFFMVTPYNFLPSHIKLKKINDPSSISISLIGISTLFGQIGIGFVSDIYRSYNWFIYSMCIILAGISTSLLPLISNVYIVYLYSIVFGFSISVNYVLQSSLVIESLGISNLTLAFGCVQLLQGVSTLIGTPFLGWVKDNSETYDSIFVISGLGMALSGIVLLIWPFCKQNLYKNEEKNVVNAEVEAFEKNGE